VVCLRPADGHQEDARQEDGSPVGETRVGVAPEDVCRVAAPRADARRVGVLRRGETQVGADPLGGVLRVGPRQAVPALGVFRFQDVMDGLPELKGALREPPVGLLPVTDAAHRSTDATGVAEPHLSGETDARHDCRHAPALLRRDLHHRGRKIRLLRRRAWHTHNQAGPRGARCFQALCRRKRLL
jgi:hypothetical protein